MVNASLREGCLSASQKHAIITPLLKKPSLDGAKMKNFRPVSNLTFISKVVERVVADQVVQYLQAHDLLAFSQRIAGTIRQRRRSCASCPTSTPPPIVKK